MGKKRVATTSLSLETRKEARTIEMDNGSDDSFWERVMNNRERQWSIVMWSLTVTTEEWERQKERARLLVEHWRRIEKDEHVDAKQTTTKWATTQKLLRDSMAEREKLSRLGSRYIATALVIRNRRRDRVDEKTIEQQIWNTIKEMREQRRTLHVAVDDMKSFLKPTKDAMKKRDPSKEAGCSFEALTRQLKQLKEHEGDRELLVKQLQERVKELDSQVERFEKEKEARAEVWVPSADDHVSWELKVEEMYVHGQSQDEPVEVDEPEDVDDPEALEMRSEDYSQEGEQQERERDLEDEAERRRQQRRAFLRERLDSRSLRRGEGAVQRDLRFIPERKREW
ncbi:unnamed protein product [Heligmosomoides polygyrus]|uniref:SOAR domain-containing protein n=1 Tax=Heligmosomoides polygyrus TaxID=6339 RepID=A0A183FYN9_HELPZ|nr:unnamed protein product [Heligmosomoides polygyrus]